MEIFLAIFKKFVNSQKINMFISFVKEIPYYFADVIVIIYSIFFNFIFFKKLYDKEFTILTGSDKYFAETLEQLIENLNRYSFISKIKIYDLGMEENQVISLAQMSQKTEIKKFDFSQYQNFISKRDSHGTLGAYGWKPNIVLKELKENKGKVIWLDSANLINNRFIFVLIVLTCKGFFSPMSAKTVKDLTFKSTIDTLQLKPSLLNKRNLTGGFVAFDWNNNKSRKLAELWAKYSNVEELILPKESNKFNHRWDQSILTVLNYKTNYFGYLPKIKKIFGIKVNQNPNQDFFLFYSGNDSKLEKFYNNWYKVNKNISTKTVKYSKIIWLLNWDSYKKVPKKYLKEKVIICNVESLEEFNEIYNNNVFKNIKIFSTNNENIYQEIIEKYDTEIIFYLIKDNLEKLTEDMVRFKKQLI